MALSEARSDVVVIPGAEVDENGKARVKAFRTTRSPAQHGAGS